MLKKYWRKKLQPKGTLHEILLCFNCSPNYAFCSQENERISVSTTGHRKAAFTVVLSCVGYGKRKKNTGDNIYEKNSTQRKFSSSK